MVPVTGALHRPLVPFLVPCGPLLSGESPYLAYVAVFVLDVISTMLCAAIF